MNYSFNGDWRSKRNINYMNFTQNYPIMHHSISNYCTETKSDMGDSKTGLNDLFGSDSYLNHLNMLPNPLQKNLADAMPVVQPTKPEYTIRTDMTAKQDLNHFTPQNIPLEPPMDVSGDSYHALSSIGSFLTGVFNVISGVIPSFTRRHKPPTGVDKNGPRINSSPNYWQESNMNEQNKNYCNHCTLESVCGTEDVDKMSAECYTAVLKCEDKINRVKSLLNSKCVVPKSSPKTRRPKKQFVPPNAVEENVIEPFVSDDIDRLANEDCVDYVSPLQNNDTALTVAAAMKIDVKAPKTDSIETKIEENVIVDEKINNEDTMKQNKELESTVFAEILPVDRVVSDTDVKTEVIQSCEDKLSKLKSLLAERRKKNTKLDVKTADTSNLDSKLNVPKIKVNCKTFKNPHRTTDKRAKCQLKCAIEEGMCFGDEIDVGSPSSVEGSPRIHFPEDTTLKPDSLEPSPNNCYFNEIKGKFHSSSTPDSEDSFQIVFNDTTNLNPRPRVISDCDSEDSFIVFEDSPDSCYISTDVFGDPSDLETDYDSEDSDSGLCGRNLGLVKPEFSRTVSDLTDDSLYIEESVEGSGGKDVVDNGCAVSDVEDEVAGKKGVLINDRRRLERKSLQPKKVSFSAAPPKVKVMRVWAFAARQARTGHWEQHVLDRDRFKRRIADVDMAISWVLKPQHRARVKFQRFMPWWHAQRRKELADKKLADEELKKAEEELRMAEELKGLADLTDSLDGLNVDPDSNVAADSDGLKVDADKDVAADSDGLKVDADNVDDAKAGLNNGNDSNVVNGDVAGVSVNENDKVCQVTNKKDIGNVNADDKLVMGVLKVDKIGKGVQKVGTPVKANGVVLHLNGASKIDLPLIHNNKFVKNNKYSKPLAALDKRTNVVKDKKHSFNNDDTVAQSTHEKELNEQKLNEKKLNDKKFNEKKLSEKKLNEKKLKEILNRNGKKKFGV